MIMNVNMVSVKYKVKNPIQHNTPKYDSIQLIHHVDQERGISIHKITANPKNLKMEVHLV